MKNNPIEISHIENILKTIYDPEFPIIDIFTLWLIYDIHIKDDTTKKTIEILMTFTTPNCPMAEILQDMIKNGIQEKYPDYETILTITFDPMRNMDMVKDPDLKRMFE